MYIGNWGGKVKAFMSYNNLAINNANFSLEGKLATLWFDNLLLGTGEELVEKVMEDVAEKEHWSVDTFKEMKKIQISSESLLPSISFMDESIIEDDYFKVATDILEDKYANELSNPATYGGAMHEISWGGFGVANSVKYWTLLNAKENCTFLPMDLEQQMLGKVFGSTTDMNYGNFSDIITAIIPDISEYSWDEIIEIRHHSYWSQFRKKLTDLSESAGDTKLEQELLEEIVRRDLAEMAQHFRPQVAKNIVKGIMSNIPLPIPINPVSVVCTGHDIMKEIDFDKKYGWIYFYLDNKK